MLYHIRPYDSISNYTIVYYTILYSTIRYYTILHCSVEGCIILYSGPLVLATSKSPGSLGTVRGMEAVIVPTVIFLK